MVLVSDIVAEVAVSVPLTSTNVSAPPPTPTKERVELGDKVALPFMVNVDLLLTCKVALLKTTRLVAAEVVRLPIETVFENWIVPVENVPEPSVPPDALNVPTACEIVAAVRVPPVKKKSFCAVMLFTVVVPVRYVTD